MKDTPFTFPQPADLDFSIVIVSFNTRDLLIDCLRSVETHTRDLASEIFVVDNASTDGSAGAVAERFPNVQLIRNPENMGLSAAANQAFRQSRGRYVVLLNSDTVLLENSFAKIVHFLDTHDEYSILSPEILDDADHPCPMRLWQDSPSDAARKILGIYSPAREVEQMAGTGPREVEAVGGSCFIVRRTLMETVGLLDANHFLYNEEDDFCRRARGAGGKICYYPETSVKHLLGQSTHQSDIRERVIIETYKSNLYFYSKYYSCGWNIVLRLLYKLTFFLGVFRSLFHRVTGRPNRGADDSIPLKLRLLFMCVKIPRPDSADRR
ncbi:MAG: glycosyltransferase family 2 protein [Nitrospinae bacterium]|nr:glycosyltransferase family 2 protein [Nitrospinota bacterium]